ncbi:MAG: AmmeMemoRadiSam system radical SAM enzyme [Candidatus Omnitrophota bacterium]
MIKEAMLYEKLPNDKVHCHLCSHHCRISTGEFGICGVRKNREGALYTHVYKEAIAANVDPIEKKPLYHFLPGTSSYSIATVGCNFKCGFCQNWQISQSNKKDNNNAAGHELSPQDIVKEAKRLNCKSISYTYTEPTIFFEYAFDTAKLAKDNGLYNNFVTNGYMSEAALCKIVPFLDAANVDLKSFNDDFYRKICQARLKPVLDSIRLMKKLRIWVEVTTLLIPRHNDSEEELEKIAEFIASVGVEIPWHISRFRPDYQFRDAVSTPIDILNKAKAIGEKAGLRYVYLGNVFEGNDTYCYNCKRLLIKRSGLGMAYLELSNGQCPDCSTALEGVF